MKAKSSELKKNYLLPRDLARTIGCSEKKIRQYCKSRKIEAIKTLGGQWRILKPLSQKTRGFLQMQGLLAWIGNGEAVGEFDDDSEMAEWLLEHIVYGKPVGESIPPDDEVDVGPVNRAAMARIRGLIREKIKKHESLSSLILRGYVYQFWLKHQREPSVSDVVELMHISWTEFYRRLHSLEEIRNAYHDCEGIRDKPTMKTF
jgi:hypothetical protein